ncbi:MAG: hypothetical protein C0501_27975 [Isosphaera sp.]|nr:hypothetical protein [Isosphaera sp.]
MFYHAAGPAGMSVAAGEPPGGVSVWEGEAPAGMRRRPGRSLALPHRDTTGRWAGVRVFGGVV